MQRKYTPSNSSDNDENLVPGDQDMGNRSRSCPPVISTTGNDGYLEPENPYTAVPDVTLLPSPGRVEKFSVLPGEVKKEPAYRKKVEAQSGDLEKEVWDQMMKAPVTLTAEHWLALSPGARQKMKTYVMPKRIPTSKVLLEDVTDAEDNEETEEPRVPLGSVANILEPGLENCIRIEDLPVKCSFYVTTMRQGLVPEGSTIISDPIVQYLESIPEGQKARTVVVVASSSQSLRSVYPLVSGRKKLECLCDSGSQIVSCSANLAKQMRWEYDPDIYILMESANRGVEKSLGLVKNVAFLFGEVTVYLQVHVLANPAYDLLLGRPFDTLTSSEVKNSSDGDQTMILTDPNTKKRTLVHTYPRGQAPAVLQREPAMGFQSSKI